ncbi:hypothetical protein PJM44_04500 [Mycobacterium kansasii]
MDEFAEDLVDAVALPEWAEQYLAAEREWHRLLRGTGAVTWEQELASIRRWLEDRPR